MGKFSRKEKIAFSSVLVLSMATLAFASYASLSLFMSEQGEEGEFPGQIALRSYFQKGTGSSTDPFVISRPVHFNNLSRLQNLGVFPTGTYFALGYDPNNPDDPYGANSGTNLRFYPDNSDSVASNMISYLDMSKQGSILSIGNEGAPFYGVFNGNGKEVCGLTIDSGPEDVGVFGYTYSGSTVENVYFNNLTVTDNGYDSGVSNLSTLYGDNASLTLNDPVLTYATKTVSTDLTSSDALFTDLTGSFVPTYPRNSPSGVVYEFRSSSNYFSYANGAITVNAGSDDDSKNYYCIANNTSFTQYDGAIMSNRLSIIAKIFNDGIFYSKVLATYLVNFIHSTTSGITMKVVRDYVNSDDTTLTKYTEYAHGVNIGFVIGHCDGSCKSCYVYQGTLSMNHTSGNLIAKAQETETGLIGEVGAGLDNEFTPQSAYAQSGDTGVVNFTKMYSEIRGDDVTSGTYVSAGDYYTYSPLSTTGAKKYYSYLRNDMKASSSYVTNATNAVDFKGRQLIADTKDSSGKVTTSRNLGVFSMVTSEWENSDSTNFFEGLGDFSVSKSTSSADYFKEFYYTTAEWKDTDASDLSVTNWSYDLDSVYSIERPIRLPSYCDEETWSPEIERYFDFIFHCDLASDADAYSMNYFAKTQSEFLQSYFHYKLIDKDGNHLDYKQGKNKDFGVFVKNVDHDAGTTANIESFDSSLKMSAPNTSDNKNDTIPTITLNGTVYPTKTIDFSIANEHGANVTVMASSSSEKGSWVGVYDKAVSLSSSVNKAKKLANQHPAYAMYLPYANYGKDDFGYFNYTLDGATSNVATINTEAPGSCLFAHTFTLPKGDYFIASPYSDVNIYYVCAQGQNNAGDTGNTATVFSNNNVVTDVDFITKSPFKDNAANDFVLADDRCWVNFEGTWSSGAGDFSVSASRASSTNTMSLTHSSNLKTLLIYDRRLLAITMDGTTSTSTYQKYPSA